MKAEHLAMKLNYLMEVGAEDALVALCTTFRPISPTAVPYVECCGSGKEPFISMLSVLNAIHDYPETKRLYITTESGSPRFAVSTKTHSMEPDDRRLS